MLSEMRSLLHDVVQYLQEVRKVTDLLVTSRILLVDTTTLSATTPKIYTYPSILTNPLFGISSNIAVDSILNFGDL